MRLLRLTLSNFKGIKSFTLEPDGEDITIYGDNATGKTTIADAISWLLFGKDSRGNAQFEIKTLGPDGEALHGLEHTVEAEFDHDYRQITLKKTYAEIWTKKRGTVNPVFSGHSTDHWVNGVPVKQKDYKEKVAEIADEELFRLLTSPSYFPEQLPWQKRRAILLEVCGGVTDGDVIASSAELQPLAAIIAGRSLDDHKKTVQASMRKINDELKAIPVRIDEAARKFEGVSSINLDEQRAIIDTTQKELNAILERIALAKTGGEIGELKKELAEAEAAVLEVENKYRQALAEETKGMENELHRLSDQVFVLGEQLRTVKQDHNRKCAEQPADNREQIKARMDALRKEFYEVFDLAYQPDNRTCPTCGQAIPEAENAEEDFNKRKAERLEKIQADGAKLKGQYDEAETVVNTETKSIAEEATDLDEQVAKIEAEIEEKKTERDELNKKVAVIRNRPVGEYPGYQEASERVASIRQRLADAQTGRNAAETDRLTAERSRLDGVLSRARERIATAELMKENDKRIADLGAEEKRLSAEYERLAHELHLCEQFVRTKVNLLEDRINSYFKLARFKLFSEQINGGLQECCEVTVDGVPYSSGLNNGARINAGLDIINALAGHYGVSMPVIVDNCESVVSPLKINSQMIRLYVSGEHKELTVA